MSERKESSEKAQQQRRLIKHSVGVFWFSTFVAGAGHTMSALKHIDNESQYRTSHVGGTVHAAVMFGLVGVLKELKLSPSDTKSLVNSILAMGWSNTLGYFVGAVLGARGLEAKPDRNIVPLSLFLIAIGGLVKTLQLVWKGAQE